jgi:quinol monooxygenase YgiN
MFHTQFIFTVGDVAQWRTVFESMESVRQQYGCTGKHVFVNADTPNEVFILLQWSDEARAREFVASPDLREAMKNAGVQGPPTIKFLNAV